MAFQAAHFLGWSLREFWVATPYLYMEMITQYNARNGKNKQTKKAEPRLIEYYDDVEGLL